jgi:hypothetical protein
MTVYCPPVDTALRLRGWAASGASDIARLIQLLVEKSLDHYLEPRLELLVPEIENLRVVSDGTSPVDLDTVRAATQFAYSLPRIGPLPEVSFDWAGPSGEMFSVSVNKHNRLAYAGWFGERSRIHGIEQLAEDCPQQIARGIEKTIR